MAHQRLDVVLVQRGLAPTRERAQALILAGAVHVGDEAATKVSQPVADGVPLSVRASENYASRGAHKLLAALDGWALSVTDLAALDVGASTGGFTDVLLRRGARRVYAVDVGYGQLDYRLRTDGRVVVMERTNVRHMGPLPEQVDLAVADVSFISLRLALPSVFMLLAPSAPVVALVKPQFEAGRGEVGKGGVVRDPAVHRRVLESLVEWSAGQPWQLADLLPSPIKGPAGNVEFLSLWWRGTRRAAAETIERAITEAARLPSGKG